MRHLKFIQVFSLLMLAACSETYRDPDGLYEFKASKCEIKNNSSSAQDNDMWVCATGNNGRYKVNITIDRASEYYNEEAPNLASRCEIKREVWSETNETDDSCFNGFNDYGGYSMFRYSSDNPMHQGVGTIFILDRGERIVIMRFWGETLATDDRMPEEERVSKIKRNKEVVKAMRLENLRKIALSLH